MPETKPNPAAAFTTAANADNGMTIFLSGTMTIESAAMLLRGITDTIARSGYPNSIQLDLSDVDRADDYGVFVTKELQDVANQHGGNLSITNIPESLESVFSLYADISPRQAPYPPPVLDPRAIITEIGGAAFLGIRKIDYTISFLGMMIFAAARAIAHPRRFRLGDTIELIQKGGVAAIPIVGLISLITGLIMAFVSSVQLSKYGGNIYIPSLIAFAMVAEIGPMLTAIIIAGRTGSAYAAEIGTMQISEEIDALSSMGFDPILFLTIPRLVAMVIALPILTVLAVIFAILGGLIVSVTMLHLMPAAYIQGVADALFIDDIIWGLAKSVIFAILIALIGCLRGFQVRGGAASVGGAATSAVVSCIFMIILADSIVAIIRIYWG
ncbi:MAG: MlaE family lipid ABC transporter permease subunit [Thermodesulfobacteriota bacterium]|nr:MlaE family lipid ABC transporter permease subunit [Thermodesulfobacteriota bacterium]